MTRASVTPVALLVPLVGVLLGEGALAQETLRRHALDEVEFNRADCDEGDEVLLQIDINGLDTFTNYRLAERLQERLPSQQGTITCPEVEQDALVQVIPENPITPVAGRYLEELNLSPVDIIGSAACDEDGARRTDVALCLYLLDGNRDEVLVNGIAVTFDTAVPEAPTLTDVEGGDERVRFTISGVDTSAGDELDYLVQYRPCETLSLDAGPADGGGGGDAGVVEADSVCGSPYDFAEERFSTANVTLTGLQNNVEYEIRARVRDDFGNTGEPSEAVLATTRPELGPLDLYDGAGSPYSFMPSCSSSRATPFALGGLALGLLLLRRRRRRAQGVGLSALLVVAVLGSSAARADFGQLHLGLHIGPYAPNLDAERVDGDPIFPIYECFFEDQLMPEAGASLGLELFDAFGSLDLVLGTTFTQVRGSTRPVEALSAGECLEPATGSVELTLVKVRPGVAYRLDPLLDLYGFPLVPYARGGLVATGYAFTQDGLFDKPEAAGVNPLGVVFGYEGALGIQLALDFLDPLDPFTPLTTQRARANQIFDHAYVFGELLYQSIDNFGRPGFNFSPQGRLFGTDAPLTAHFGISLELL